MDDTVIAGIDPDTRECAMVGVDDDSSWAEARACGYIVVRVTKETARSIWGQAVPDLYAITAPMTPRAQRIQEVRK